MTTREFTLKKLENVKKTAGNELHSATIFFMDGFGIASVRSAYFENNYETSYWLRTVEAECSKFGYPYVSYMDLEKKNTYKVEDYLTKAVVI